MGDRMRRKQPSAQSLRHYRTCLLFPHDLSIYLSLTPAPGKALAARDAVEAAWCRTPEEVAAAKRAAEEILRAAGIDQFRFGERTYSPEDCANLYGIRAEDLLREGGA